MVSKTLTPIILTKNTKKWTKKEQNEAEKSVFTAIMAGKMAGLLRIRRENLPSQIWPRTIPHLFQSDAISSSIPHSSGLRPCPNVPVKMENDHFSSGFLRRNMISGGKTVDSSGKIILSTFQIWNPFFQRIFAFWDILKNVKDFLEPKWRKNGLFLINLPPSYNAMFMKF